jgi:RNA polymerase sigma factor (sigma-70 family)
MFKQSVTPQEELARNASDYRRRLQSRFGDRLSAEDVEDIIQSALLKAPADDDGRNERQRHAWFARVVHNAAIDYLRARDGRYRAGRGPRVTSLERIGDVYDGEPEAAVAALRVDESGFDPELLDRGFEVDAIRQLVGRALARLPREDRRMIGLRYRDGLTNAQLANELGLSMKGLEKRWARGWVAFVTAAAGSDVAGENCPKLRSLAAVGEIGVMAPDAVARWEAHLEECVACRIWQHVGSQAAGLIGGLPLGGGVIGGLLSKLGAGGLLERVHASADQVASAAGAGGGAGAGVGVLGAIGGKAAATCITAAVCVGAGAYVATPVVQRVLTPQDKSAKAVAAEASRSQAAGGSAAQRPSITTVSSAPASVAPQAARQATRTQASVQATSAQRKTERETAKVARERAQAKQARATGSPFTPEANDPTPAAVAASAPAPAPAPASAPTPPPAPDNTSHFTSEFSP